VCRKCINIEILSLSNPNTEEKKMSSLAYNEVIFGFLVLMTKIRNVIELDA